MNNDQTSTSRPKSPRRTEDALRPVTIRQALDAKFNFLEKQFTLGKDILKHITIVAQVHDVTMKSEEDGGYRVAYQLDDGTSKGTIKAFWSIAAPVSDPTGYEFTSEYVRVVGELGGMKRSDNRRNLLSVKSIRKVEHPLEVYFHLLEVMAATVSYKSGPPTALDLSDTPQTYSQSQVAAPHHIQSSDDNLATSAQRPSLRDPGSSGGPSASFSVSSVTSAFSHLAVSPHDSSASASGITPSSFTQAVDTSSTANVEEQEYQPTELDSPVSSKHSRSTSLSSGLSYRTADVPSGSEDVEPPVDNPPPPEAPATPAKQRRPDPLSYLSGLDRTILLILQEAPTKPVPRELILQSVRGSLKFEGFSYQKDGIGSLTHLIGKGLVEEKPEGMYSPTGMSLQYPSSDLLQ